ncbi:MAG: hypothetical protein Q8M88_10825 [Phenylobacterium sp.]|uniref:hypothetical protein n=1 Tax=Phenylobacterium sp. TaxID=1871053 RepID=UPI002735D7E5|nr:hypothetical protein [Phenylobacterium sp.]MDP3174913.1 hypothetical protein [Phenylobacterium sp.]
MAFAQVTVARAAAFVALLGLLAGCALPSQFIFTNATDRIVTLQLETVAEKPRARSVTVQPGRSRTLLTGAIPAYPTLSITSGLCNHHYEVPRLERPPTESWLLRLTIKPDMSLVATLRRVGESPSLARYSDLAEPMVVLRPFSTVCP